MARLACMVAMVMMSGVTAAGAQTLAAVGTQAQVSVFAQGLEHPWGLAFLPDGRALVTERPGRLRIVDKNGTLSAPLDGVPKVEEDGQGGLLDVAVDPDFAKNRLIYLTFSEPGKGGSGTAALRARLTDRGLEEGTMIFRQARKVDSGRHFGSRLAFAKDGTLFVTLGDRGDYAKLAQDLSTHFGKIVRIRPDGSVPADNPFVGEAGAMPEIWSYGHRNVQGAAIDAASGRLWTVEHGARGGDELNHPMAGRNYGWPVITYGRDYSGEKIGIGQSKTGMEQPVHYWDPSIAPSGLTFYTATTLPGWQGSLFVGALAGQNLFRLELDNDRVVKVESVLDDLGMRIRDVRQGPDGLLYLLTDADDGQILRIEPKTAASP